MYPYPCNYAQIADDLQCVLDCFNGCPAWGGCDCERAVWAVTGFVRCMGDPDCPCADKIKLMKGKMLDKKHLKYYYHYIPIDIFALLLALFLPN